MFVEKLSLFGFKSFNQRVTLDFDGGISGIIGPNGCGKSNIVDAIRWVLGEQSYKTLRGGKMEDVIFNGTRDEKPLSLAEVELTLNNDAGRLPIEFNTVAVARRLYRSGNSEYLINRKPVRLRDVRDLFMDTGMGSHAYSVIERQMVDNILSDTTGHRRFLFEEAAGIMKYKTRKKEALLKLDATERDLLRVNDIISEVERQVNSLRRQVGKARRYREVSEEIRNLDLAWSQGRRRAWQEQLATLGNAHREASSRAESAETQVATLEAALEELHLTVLTEERRLAEAREALADVDDEIGRSNSRLLVLRERLDSTHTRIREAGEHKVRLTDRRSRNTESAREVAGRLEDLRRRETGERQVLDDREAELERIQARLSEVRDAARVAQEEAARFRDERIRAEGQVDSSRRRLEDQERRLSSLREKLEEASGQREERASALEVSRGNVEKARRRLEELEEDLRVLDTRRGNHAERTELQRRALAEKREEEAAARSRLATLEDLRQRYEGFDRGVRALLAEGERHPGLLGALGDLIEVPAPWTAALEPVLSRIWQLVAVRDTNTARHLIDRLREEGLGFAAFLPLDRVPAGEAPAGDLTWASEVVGTDDAYRPLLRHLLGDLALVSDLEEALAVVREGKAARAATRTGQFVDAAVVAGGVGGPQGSELVEREESLTRCRSAVESAAHVLVELSAHGEELEEEGRELEETHARRTEEREDARRVLTSLEKEEAALGQELRHAEETLAQRREEEAQLRRLCEESAGERGGLEGRLHDSEEAAERADRMLSEAELKRKEIEEERERILTAVHELRLQWSRLEGELRDAESTAGRLDAEREELALDWDRTVKDEADAGVLVGEIEEELTTLGDAIQELHKRRDERAEVVAEREREKSEATALEQQDATRVREARREATGARQEAHDLELRLSEIRGHLSHLEERLREEYEMEAGSLDAVPAGEVPENVAEVLADLRDRLRRMGAVNLLAVEEYEEKSQRFEFMTTQRDDLVRAKDSLHKTIAEINKTASGMFLDTFTVVQENFQRTFKVLFQGGECSLTLTGDDPLEADIEVTARPLGKKPQSIAQLSSGERALTAIALLFAIYLVKPSPFCILDEVDAPLDDANIDRFVNMLKEFSNRTQFIVITHNKKTMEAADCLYGVTMQKAGVSSVVSVRLDGARGRAALRPGAGDGNGKGNGNGHGDGTSDPGSDPLSPESAILQ